MKMSESIANISAGLVQFQGLVNNPEKKSINPHFKSKYADLDEVINTIRPALEKCGLAFIQNPIHEDGKVGVYTLLIHKSGEFIQFDPVMIPLQKATPHQVGAALTYAKRYSLGSALGLATEEDKDGNEINNHKNQSIKNKQAKQETLGERKAKGIKAMYDEVKRKNLTEDEYKAILKAETGKTDAKELDLEQIIGLYKFLKNHTSDELKETARAYMEQQKAAGAA